MIVADAASVGPFTAPLPLFEVHSRFAQLAWYNELGQALTNVAGDHYITVWPVGQEIQ